ncbi:uncharacterized protein si:dkey-112e17.1 [Syngnathoides biaculeatus]|uniref:uncharacterized protein si:dkey-112e17.1 n=1 Tax=Syngnathoides biaculeatus TaxID=300417 RepID=UPI002ADE2B94|nr:uncharacterized protein si:dkey-112e17.1 [Syngnathoides biaculeatus]
MTCIGGYVSMTAYLLFLMGSLAQKVYFDCGAKVDVVDVRGLILSPGFPYNYSSGTHCVWQFFVPINYQLILEIFDFDVFESHDTSAQYSANSNFEDDNDDGKNEVTYAPNMLASDGPLTADIDHVDQTIVSKIQQSSQDSELEKVMVHEQSKKIEMAKVSNSAKRFIAHSSGLTLLPTASLLLPVAVLNTDKAINTASPSRLRVHPSSISSMSSVTQVPFLQSTSTASVSPGTQQSGFDACPHDVLYISDLITFSSRFCGSNRPPSSQLVFGSSQEMVEVIMELITTTHWGRGFALLFHYNNLINPDDEQRSFVSTSAKLDPLLAAVSGAAFFALILTSALCVIFRPKLCLKRESSRASTSTEVPEAIQNTRVEISELQPMAESQTNQEVNRNQENKYSPPHIVSAGGDTSQNTELDLSSSGLAELDFGPDEVFIISSGPSPHRPSFSSHTQRERFLSHSDTGPGPVGDWPPPDSTPSPSGPTSDGRGGCARPRAWSVRTFQEFLPPLPQLHKKWCSWNSTSPFTKLVDSAPPSVVSDNRKVFSDVHLAAKNETSTISDSSISNASYPLAQAAQRQRRLNSTSNLRRSRFTGPCFGLLSETGDLIKTTGLNNAQRSQPESVSSSSIHCAIESNQTTKRQDFPSEGDHINVPVFAISEEEDRQPLVSAEHLDRTTCTTIQNGLVRGTFDSKRPACVSSVNSQNQRVRLEWRPWGNQMLEGVCSFPSNTPTTTTKSNSFDCQFPHSQNSVWCSVTNHV